jgi:gluconolactonase
MLWDTDHGLERLATGGTWLEGPAWVGDRLLVSDIPGNRVLAWSEGATEFEVAIADAEFPNGRTVTRDGRVYQCSHGRRAVEELLPDLSTRVLVDRSPYGTRLNSPNDLVVARDGSIWFTDPPYGILMPEEGHPGELEYGECHVFRLSPEGDLTTVVTGLERPNGLAFSSDETVLYVADTSQPPWQVWRYPVIGDHVGEGIVCYTGSSGPIDGFRVDVEGRCWFSDGESVAVMAPDGHVLDTIDVPERVANVCFGPDGWLYIAATTTLYRVRTFSSDAALAD